MQVLSQREIKLKEEMVQAQKVLQAYLLLEKITKNEREYVSQGPIRRDETRGE